MARSSTRKCQRKSKKTCKNRKTKRQNGGGFFFDSEWEKVYSILSGQLSKEESKKFAPYKEQVKTNIKSLLDAADKIKYKEMLRKNLDTHIVKKLGNCRAQASRMHLEQCLQSIIPANINLTDQINKQIDNMLNSYR